MRGRASRQVNLTEGPILSSLLRLAAPIMATAFLSTAYNLTDVFWVGQLGARAVAGIGTGGMYLWLSGGVTVLARTGSQVYAARSIGEGNREKARGYAMAAIRLAALLGLVYGLICAVFAPVLISFFRLNDAETFAHAVSYLRIAGGCIVFSFLSQVMTGLFTAQADSRTPFICNVLGLVINMILDPVLILGAGIFPRLEATGAALATVIAQLIVFVVMLFMILTDKNEDNILSPSFGRSRPDAEIPRLPYTSQILRLSAPHAVQSMMYCVFSMIMARLIAPFGDGAIAVQRVGGQIEAISWNVSDGFAASLNAFTAQNRGAGKRDRYVRGYYLSAGVLFAWGSLITVLFFLHARGIASLFFHEEAVIVIAVSYLTIISVCEPFMCIEILTVGALAALEKTRLSSLISITLTGIRIPLVLILVSAGLGVPSFWWALSMTSVCKGIVFFTAYRLITRKRTGNPSVSE